MVDEVEVPEYRLSGDFFCEPDLIKAGTIIRWDGPPNSVMEPLNEAAELRMEEHYKRKPHARLNPIEQLPIQQVTVLAGPKDDNEKILDLASAQLSKAVDASGPTPKKGKEGA